MLPGIFIHNRRCLEAVGMPTPVYTYTTHSPVTPPGQGTRSSGIGLAAPRHAWPCNMVGWDWVLQNQTKWNYHDGYVMHIHKNNRAAGTSVEQLL